MRLIGLTGGIASGKSTVSNMLRELGATILDADQLAREVVEPGTPGLAAVAKRFPGVVGADGKLDRAKLGERVFSNANERAALNAILHPLIQESFLARIAELADGGARLVLYDAPLLIENDLQVFMDGVVVVSVPPQLQLERLLSRDGLTREQAEARLSAQLPLASKLQHARWVIDNSGDIESTRGQVQRLWSELQTQV
jgi:dephospho-CoA kinase